MSGEAAMRACMLSMASATAAAALSRSPALTAAALILAGSMWTMAFTLLDIGAQLSAPRWVAGRALATYLASYSGGIAFGSWGWGRLTDAAGVETALLVSAALMLVSPLLGLWLRMPRISVHEEGIEMSSDPEVRLPLTNRSGPLVVEIEYRVAPENARAFHKVMQDIQLSRQRNGAYGWSIARNIADPELWIERYHCPTWLDYLRQRNRWTQSDRALDEEAAAFHIGSEPVRIRRLLERPLRIGALEGRRARPRPKRSRPVRRARRRTLRSFLVGHRPITLGQICDDSPSRRCHTATAKNQSTRIDQQSCTGPCCRTIARRPAVGCVDD
ncbi:hypothetical protein ACVWZR_002122 [Bradyrhizobium sp. i1.3.1]